MILVPSIARNRENSQPEILDIKKWPFSQSPISCRGERTFTTQGMNTEWINEHQPGDSSCDLCIPLVGGHLTFPKGHLTIPKWSLWIIKFHWSQPPYGESPFFVCAPHLCDGFIYAKLQWCVSGLLGYVCYLLLGLVTWVLHNLDTLDFHLNDWISKPQMALKNSSGSSGGWFFQR